MFGGDTAGIPQKVAETGFPKGALVRSILNKANIYFDLSIDIIMF